MGVEHDTLDQLKIERRPSRRRGSGWILVVLLVLLLLGGLGFWWQGRGQSVEVKTITVQASASNGQFTVLNASGYVTARREATVSSKVTGKIVDVLVEEGMSVKEGDVLARLDLTNVEANLALARAQVQVARTTLRETEVRLDEAGIELRRVQALVPEGILTEADLDAAQAEVSSLRARLERQKDEVTVAERQLGVWEQEKEDRVIRAPFAGVVISKDAQPGEMISPVSAGGGFTRTGICTLVDMDSLEIEVDVNESYINKVSPGQRVEATLDAYTFWKIPSQVIAIIPAADRQKATVKVRIGFESLDPRILPDMGVKVAFQDGDGSESTPSRPVLMIPEAAVVDASGQSVVFVVTDGRVERRAVGVGGRGPQGVEITAGLQGGERVVVEGAKQVSDGQAVREHTP